MAGASAADRINDGVRLLTIAGPLVGIFLVYIRNFKTANEKILPALYWLLAFIAVSLLVYFLIGLRS
jgi:lipid-A-disaccharide synthase-like uncharacterized protein